MLLRNTLLTLLLLNNSLALANEIECDEENSLSEISAHTSNECNKKFNEESKNNKHQYDLSFCDNGRFELKLETYFPYAESPEEVFSNYFLNGANIQKTSNLLQSTAPKIWLDGKVYSGKASGLKGKTFKIETHPKKSFSTRNFYSTCKLTPTGESLTQDCSISMESGDGKEYFKSSEKNSTNVKCTKEVVGVKCAIIVKGAPKSISGILYSNTAEKLAVSGAIETMRDMFNLSYLDHGCTPGRASENTKGTTFFDKNLEPFWEKVTGKVENLEGARSQVKVKSGAEGFTVKTISDTDDCK